MDDEIIKEFDNIYNRLVVYPSDEWHSLNSSFGNTIEDGRLTFTMFCVLHQKNIKSMI